MNLENFQTYLESSSASNEICINAMGQVVMPHHEHRFTAYSTGGKGSHMGVYIKDKQWVEGQSSAVNADIRTAMCWMAGRILFNV